MALRKDKHKDEELAPVPQDGEQQGQVIERTVSEASPAIRPEILAVGRSVIAEDRGLLERLAAFDRGETPGN